MDAVLTGAYIENLEITPETILAGVKCEYIYWGRDRLPEDPNTTFQPGEFEALILSQ